MHQAVCLPKRLHIANEQLCRVIYVDGAISTFILLAPRKFLAHKIHSMCLRSLDIFIASIYEKMGSSLYIASGERDKRDRNSSELSINLLDGASLGKVSFDSRPRNFVHPANSPSFLRLASCCDEKNSSNPFPKRQKRHEVSFRCYLDVNKGIFRTRFVVVGQKNPDCTPASECFVAVSSIISRMRRPCRWGHLREVTVAFVVTCWAAKSKELIDFRSYSHPGMMPTDEEQWG